MNEKELIKYLKQKAEECWEKAWKCIASRETRAWYEGQAEAYEDIAFYIEKPYLDG